MNSSFLATWKILTSLKDSGFYQINHIFLFNNIDNNMYKYYVHSTTPSFSGGSRLRNVNL